jgi:hypothetical protein
MLARRARRIAQVRCFMRIFWAADTIKPATCAGFIKVWPAEARTGGGLGGLMDSPGTSLSPTGHATKVASGWGEFKQKIRPNTDLRHL